MIIYPTHNRLYYTQITLPQVIKESKGQRLVVYDDNSEDGTKEFLDKFDIEVIHHSAHSSTYCINEAMKFGDEYIIKIDNDILIPDGYVKTLLLVMKDQPQIKYLGLREVAGLPYIRSRKYEIARWIGGVGIFRELREPIKSNNRYYGFTKYQANGISAWLDGGNTNLDMSCWSRSDIYIRKNWSRKMAENGTVFRLDT